MFFYVGGRDDIPKENVDVVPGLRVLVNHQSLKGGLLG